MKQKGCQKNENDLAKKIWVDIKKTLFKLKEVLEKERIERKVYKILMLWVI
jgi:hypothetical protein